MTTRTKEIRISGKTMKIIKRAGGIKANIIHLLLIRHVVKEYF